MRTRAAVRRQALWFEFNNTNREDVHAMTWKVLLGYVFSAVGAQMGPLGKVGLVLLKRLLKYDETEMVPVVSTPDELKDVIERYLRALLTQYVGDNLISELLTKVLTSLTDSVIDMIWDRLALAGHLGDRISAFPGRGVIPMMAAPATADPLAMAAEAELCP